MAEVCLLAIVKAMSGFSPASTFSRNAASRGFGLQRRSYLNAQSRFFGCERRIVTLPYYATICLNTDRGEFLAVA